MNHGILEELSSIFKYHCSYKLPRGTLLAGTVNTWVWKNLQFSTENAPYLGNDMT